MRIAVLSDIHSNLEALEAVVADLEHRDVDRVICLGDIIGYGPDPQQVVELVRSKGYWSVLGNHEFALGDIRGRRWLNFLAAENNELTAALLSPENRDYCRKLPAWLELEGAHFVHGYPKDNVFRYLSRQTDDQIKTLLTTYPASFFFIGHTHKLELITMEGAEIKRKKIPQGRVPLKKDQKYIINCGSVGQPRDGDRRAKYLVWDSISSEIELNRIDYDFQRTMEKIRRLGFPEAYAKRLG